ncbi:carboxypeptidase T [Saccharopolyspora erythraea NRRL 2338]|uniref:M14 family metallopeptidase n=1 Tax=Saccharopolyspora erythraea TaxID=1836 RepID=A0ABP3M2Y6_SACER|nr:M14 family metallopeptidase [Saccharopolyspora erythraea]EQD83877.1 carboxypeptidase [Saccharopolyspora erythraea D]PFG98602.1 carboxypeptidase T [Saccharopolyspora erythraea NRRL 2338]QRK88640.1 zinc carboxypeptidase [Saccharopolyspora erythraea]
MFSSRRTASAVTALACLILLPAAQAGVSAAQEASPTGAAATADAGSVYSVPGTDSRSRTEINRTGAQVLSVRDGVATVQATREQARRLRAAGFALEEQQDVAAALDALSGPEAGIAGAADFPPADRGFHNFDEMNAELDKAVQDHRAIAVRSSIGRSYQGRDIPMLKISDNAAQDENEPEVLFNCNQHAREHLTTEMCLHIINRFTDGYATNPAVKSVVDSREIWVVPVTNPDGSVYDVASGQYQGWRKNRQGSGTDTNRNWGYRWGCCGGSSSNPNSDTYRGSAAFSAPESAALARFVDSRVVGGKQQIRAHIDWHTFSELVLWPYGYTYNNTAEGMTQQEYDRFARVGTEMARTNGYTPQQSSDLYITDGSTTDWMWGKHKIFSFTFEMYPSGGGIDGFYPDDEVIGRETARNDAAVDILLREAGV